jgi:PadR family transcriptional regulator PadR
MLHDFYLGFIKIHILHHARREAVYGLWLIEELNHHGYQLSPGTLYPILHSLEKKGYIQSVKQKVAGKIRIYYKTTDKGSIALDEAKIKVRELIREVLFTDDHIEVE